MRAPNRVNFGWRVLHRATRVWLADGTIEGKTFAELYADRDGRLPPLA